MTEQKWSSSGTFQSSRASSSKPYLSVSVTDPVKLGNGVQAHISYRVVTKLKADSEEGKRRFKMIVRNMMNRLYDSRSKITLDMGITFHELAKGHAQSTHRIADAWRSS